jgi:DNA-binding NarL/FixJ family response regulator
MGAPQPVDSGAAAAARDNAWPGGSPPRVLVVEPADAARTALTMALTDAGCQVVASLRTAIGATYACRTLAPTVIVCELDLRPAGAWSGLLAIASLATEGGAVPVLALARPDLGYLAERVTGAGARRLLRHGDLAGLVAAVNEAHGSNVEAVHPSGEVGARGAGARVGGPHGPQPGLPQAPG